MPDFHAMTMAELIAHKDSLKAERVRINEEMRAAAIALQAKITQWHIDQATEAVTKAASAAGRTPEEQANFWLSEQYADPGRHLLARRFLEQRIVNVEDL